VPGAGTAKSGAGPSGTCAARAAAASVPKPESTMKNAVFRSWPLSMIVCGPATAGAAGREATSESGIGGAAAGGSGTSALDGTGGDAAGGCASAGVGAGPSLRAGAGAAAARRAIRALSST